MFGSNYFGQEYFGQGYAGNSTTSQTQGAKARIILSTSNNLALSSGATWAASVPSQLSSNANSVAFDSTANGKAVMASIINLAAAGSTLSFWFKKTTAASDEILLTYNDNTVYGGLPYIRSQSATDISIEGNGGSIRSFAVPTMANNTWYHVAIVRNGTVDRVYLNGIESTSGGLTQTTGDLYLNQIGDYFGNSGVKFIGNFAEIRKFDFALSATDIATLSTGANITTDSSLYLKMYEGSGTIAYDTITIQQNRTQQTVTGKSRILKTVSQTITAKSRISATTQQTISGKGNIRRGNGILLSNFYLSSTEPAPVTPPMETTWLNSGSGTVVRKMLSFRDGSAMTLVTSAANNTSSNQNILIQRYVSDTLTQQVLTGLINVNLIVRAQASSLAVGTPQIVASASLVSRDGTVLRSSSPATIFGGGDLTTTLTAAYCSINIQGTAAGFQVNEGDRIEVEIAWAFHTAPTGNGGVTVSASFGANASTDLNTGDTAAKNPIIFLGTGLYFQGETQTLGGVSNIRATTLKTIGGVANIAPVPSTQRTITGSSRIRKTVQQAQLGVARVQKTTTQTITGKASLVQTRLQTKTGKSRIQTIETWNTSGVANIFGTTQRTIGGTANIYVATRFYFSNTAVADITTAFNQTSFVAVTTAADRKKLLPYPDGSVMTSKAFSITNGSSALNRQYISAPLAAQTIDLNSMQWKMQLRASEAATSGNGRMYAKVAIYVVSNDGTTLRGIIETSWNAAEIISTTLTNRSFGTFRENIISAQDGDRIVVEIGGQFDFGNAARNQTQSFGADSGTDLPENTTETAAYNGWIEFPQYIAFKPSAQTISGKASITLPTTNKIITGNSRIRTTVQQAQTGVSRLQKTTSQTVTSKARITVTTTKNETGKARVTATSLQSITGKSRITSTALKTELGKARVTAATNQNLSGKARITSTSSQSITGKGRVRSTVLQTITGKARVTNASIQTQNGKARITVTASQTIPGASRIQNVYNKTISGKAAIRNSSVQNIQGKSRILVTNTQSLTGKAAIKSFGVTTISGKARINTISNIDQYGIARIQIASEQIIGGKSAIQSTANKDITGKAFIRTRRPRSYGYILGI